VTVARRVAIALQAHPELAALHVLAGSGQWSFSQEFDGFLPVAVIGQRDWLNGWLDVVDVRDPDGVVGLRYFAPGPHDEPVVSWRRQDGLIRVVHGLLQLPPPEHRTAPRLQLPTVPGSRRNVVPLWRPGTRR
jgi:hypothetical protein